MKNFDFKKNFKTFAVVLLGCILEAFAIAFILKPSGLICGGVAGIAIILDKVFGLNYAYVNYGFAIVILVLAWLILGKEEGLKIITLSIVYPMILVVFSKFNIPFIHNDIVLSTIFYGIVCGLGCGIIYKSGYSQGGSDTIAKILRKKFLPFLTIGEIVLITDSIVILVSAVIYGTNIALYAVVAQIIFTKAANMVAFGFGTKKVEVKIISDHNIEITDYILHKLHIGVTSYEVTGSYMNQQRTKLSTICSPKQSMQIKEFVASVDSNAFVTIVPINFAWGSSKNFTGIAEQ